MGLFLWGLYSYINNRNFLKYALCIALASCFHLTAIFFIVVPFIGRLFSYKTLANPMVLICVTIAAFFIGFLFTYFVIVIGRLIPKFAGYSARAAQASTFSIAPVAVRTALAFFVFVSRPKEMTRFDRKLYKFYLLGFLFYLLVCRISLLSRVTDYLSMIEFILIPNLLTRQKRPIRQLLLLPFAAVFLTLFVKDIQSFQTLAGYRSSNPVEYPYITIFNQDDLMPYLRSKK
jgi:hypothetical protein